MDESVTKPGEAGALRIFVVENHPDTLRYLRMYLEQEGHEVESAGSVAEALGKIPTVNCDVLISDIGLPDATGWELMQKVRALQPIFAVAMSGFGMSADHLKSKAAGFRHHLLKPFMPDELDEILAEAKAEKEQKLALAAGAG